MIDSEAQRTIEREMQSGERLLWTSKPDPSRLSARMIVPAIFGIPFTAFAIFWVAGAWSMTRNSPFPSNGFDNIFPLFGLIFVFIGLAIMSSPFWAFAKGTRTVYGISDRRALVIEGGSSQTTKSYSFSDMEDLERTERADGSGDLIFKRETRRGAKGRTYLEPIGFFGVPNVREVENTLRQAREQFLSNQ
jgi:hypothetical protein